MFGKISKIDFVQAPVYLGKNRVISCREKQIISKFEDYLMIKDASTPQGLYVLDIKACEFYLHLQKSNDKLCRYIMMLRCLKSLT